MSPSCSLTSAHILLIPICFTDSRQSCHEGIPGRFLRVTSRNLCRGGHERALGGSRAHRRKPPSPAQALLTLGSATIHVFKQSCVGYPPNLMIFILHLCIISRLAINVIHRILGMGANMLYRVGTGRVLVIRSLVSRDLKGMNERSWARAFWAESTADAAP